MRLKFSYIIFCVLFFSISDVLNAINNDPQTLSFVQAAELAVCNSADLKYSYSTQTLMEKAWQAGIREYFPRINISVSENDRLQMYGADSFIKNYGVSLDQLLFDGGRLRMSRNIEKTELNLSSYRLGRMASEIAETAITAYRKVLSSRAILEIKKAAFLILEEQFFIMKEEERLGMALPVDLANAKINLTDAKLGINSLQLDLIEMERQFAELLGLDNLPVLTESVDINHTVLLPDASAAAALAREKNPDLIEARYSISKRKTELIYHSVSWIPTFRLTGNFGLSGQNYPLTRFNWSVGINIDLSNPWLQNRFGFQVGWEAQQDRTAMLQNSFTPADSPAAGYGIKQAEIALAAEQEKFNTALDQIERAASNAIEKCALTGQKCLLAVEASSIGAERCRIEEIRLNLGHITRLDLMEVLIEQTQREIAVVETVTSLLEAERMLERFLDLRPGELAKFALITNKSILKEE